MKTIISTGQGRLYLVESAQAIKNAGIQVKVITGWVPSKNIPDSFINLLGRIVGRKNISYGLRKRNPIELDSKEIKSCSFAEFSIQFLFLLSKFTLINNNLASKWGWIIYGWQSKRHIKNANIFHVRSAAGQGGAIKRAIKNGMIVIADHSIAHPAYMERHLAEEYTKNNVIFNLGMASTLFQLTIKDASMAHYVLVNSNFVKKTFIEQGFPENKLKVIHQGVRKDFMGLKTNYSSGKISKLLFTGGFGFRKGGEYLLKSLQQLEAEGYNFEMNIVGSYSEAIPLIKKYPVKSIKFIGFVPQDELKKYLKEADLYIFPSLSEGCASSGMEALAAGLPVIATEESGFPIDNQIDGLIIPSKNSYALSEAIKELINDKNKRATLGKNAAIKIRNLYSWEMYAEKIAEFYKEILAEKK